MIQERTLKLIIFFFAICSIASAKTYYVSTSGKDSYDGLTKSTPWATLAYAESHATSQGDIIALKKGDKWTLTKTLYITHGGISGHSIVWDGSLWGDGVNAIIQTTTALGLGVINIGGCSYVTIEKLKIDANKTDTQGIIIGSYYLQNNEHYITIQDCVINNIGDASENYHGVYVETWRNDMYNIIIQRNSFNYIAGCAAFLYCGRTLMGATPAEIHDSYIGYNTITNYSTAGTAECIGINNRVSNAIIEHNTSTVGEYGQYANGIVVGSGEFDNGAGQVGWYPTGLVVRYNDIRTYDYPAVYIQGCQAQSLTFYYNKFYQEKASTTAKNGVIRIEKDYAALTYAGADIRFYNNTIVSSSGASSCFADLTQYNGVVDLKNNLMINTGSSGSMGLCYIDVSGSTVHSYNSYYRSAVGDLIYYFYMTPYIQYYRTDTASIEETGIFSNPKLTDVAGFDWTLQASSPCINSGIDVGLTLDYAGNPVADKPDIGAYEYGYNNNNTKSMMFIFPNPTRKLINISLEGELPTINHTVRLINMAGKIIQIEKLPPGIKDFQIPINIIPGVYIMQLVSGNSTAATQKLIVLN
jgi:hypothetical protein